MNAFLSNTFINLFGSKAVRFALAYLAAEAAKVGVTLDTNSVYTFIASGLVFLAIIVWSVVAKHKPDAADQSKLADFAHAIASLIVPAILGTLHAKGISVTGSDSMEVVLLGALQVAASGLNKPDAKAGRK